MDRGGATASGVVVRKRSSIFSFFWYCVPTWRVCSSAICSSYEYLSVYFVVDETAVIVKKMVQRTCERTVDDRTVKKSLSANNSRDNVISRCRFTSILS